MRAQPEPSAAEEGSKLSSLESSGDDDDERPWTVVSKGRKKSKNSHVNIASEYKKEVSDPVLAEAERNLTPDERNRIHSRYKNVHKKMDANNSSESKVSSKGEGPSKGKGVDPGNWGAAELSPEEMDADVQEAALASYKVAKELLNKNEAMKKQDAPEEKQAQRKAKRHKITRAQKKPAQSDDDEEPIRNKDRASSKLTPMSETVAERVANMVKEKVGPKAAINPINKPANQITTNSYLGRALEEVRERSATHDTPIPSSDSSSSSSSSSSDSEPESEDSARRYRSNRHTG
jgi:hypothetical protein